MLNGVRKTAAFALLKKCASAVCAISLPGYGLSLPDTVYGDLSLGAYEDELLLEHRDQ
jgi:hypothetical protein